MNRAWHEAHPMPRNPTEEQRLDWHLAHARACACRDIPASILDLMQARGIARPEFEEAGPEETGRGDEG